MESPPNDSLTISSNNNENVVVEVDLAQLQVLSTEDEENNEEKKEENTDNVPIVDEINYDGTYNITKIGPI
jgi:protein-tyrosine phosphatase